MHTCLKYTGNIQFVFHGLILQGHYLEGTRKIINTCLGWLLCNWESLICLSAYVVVVITLGKTTCTMGHFETKWWTQLKKKHQNWNWAKECLEWTASANSESWNFKPQIIIRNLGSCSQTEPCNWTYKTYHGSF